MTIAKGSRIVVQDEGVTQGVVGTLNFTGAGVTASVAGSTATVNITGGGGGGGSATTAVVTALTASKRMEVTVTDASVSTSSKIMLSLASMPDTAQNADDDIDLLGMYAIPGTGSFVFRASFLTPFLGPLSINYMVL